MTEQTEAQKIIGNLDAHWPVMSDDQRRVHLLEALALLPSQPVQESEGEERRGVQVRPVSAKDAIAGLYVIFDDLQKNFHDQWDWMKAYSYVELLKAELEDAATPIQAQEGEDEESGLVSRWEVLAQASNSDSLYEFETDLKRLHDTNPEVDVQVRALQSQQAVAGVGEDGLPKLDPTEEDYKAAYRYEDEVLNAFDMNGWDYETWRKHAPNDSIGSRAIVDRFCRERQLRAVLQASRQGEWITDGASLIAAERQRQVQGEGWTSEHDAEHTQGQLTLAAISYAHRAKNLVLGAEPENLPLLPGGWPWDYSWWKPSPDPIRNLVKAGALIAAEIDRIRALPSPPTSTPPVSLAVDAEAHHAPST